MGFIILWIWKLIVTCPRCGVERGVKHFNAGYGCRGELRGFGPWRGV
jgi:hypothetical protein